ncbi:MAG TPA: type II secretion system protein GspM [Desulfohalobiaceae bacterium]|nr:type II secretion system protein GspM [Desulfohalobiaceae bacterium]
MNIDKLLELKDSLKLLSYSKKANLRILLFGFAGLLFVIVVFRTAWNVYWQYSKEFQHQIELKQIQYERLARILEKKGQYASMNKALRGYKEELVSKRFVQGETQTLAEAKFQNIVNGLANETEINILSMRVLPSKRYDNLQSLRLGINCRAEIGAINEFIVKIYENKRFIFFDQLEIKIVHRREHRYYNFNAELSAWTEI